MRVTYAQNTPPAWIRRLNSFWVTPGPQDDPHTTAATRTLQPAAYAARAAWPLALLLIIHRVVILARQGSQTDDFTTVWAAARRFVERVPVYNEVYHHVDPHYLYNPGATLLLSPLGLFSDASLIRPLFILANVVAILVALALLTRLSGKSLTHPLFPISIALSFCTESVVNTLVFSNINGVLLLLFTIFLYSYIRKRFVLAGVCLGVAILVKPMFAPLIVLPLMQLRWRCLLPSVFTPVVFNLVAWPLTPGARDYIDVVVPYLAITRDYANSSLPGFTTYFGLPAQSYDALFIVFGAAVAIAVLGLARWRWSDEYLWLTMSSTVLLAGVCLLSSLGQAYYSMMLFPAAFTVLAPRSPMHTSGPWVGLMFCLAPLQWTTLQNPLIGRWITTFLPTLGWALFIVTTATWVLTTLLTTKKGAYDTHARESISGDNGRGVEVSPHP
ncbi:arabinofuranosyl transferase [Corynebacterium sp. NML130628]|nr:arabinofuranosyl transferase [Corynebacterium sp. NML130628]